MVLASRDRQAAVMSARAMVRGELGGSRVVAFGDPRTVALLEHQLLLGQEVVGEGGVQGHLRFRRASSAGVSKRR